MTELETIQRAKMYLDKLSQGFDPITNLRVNDETLNNPRISRCFSYISGILDKVIANGGQVGAVEKKEFAIHPEQLRRVEITANPISISDFADGLLRAAGDPLMKRPNPIKINKWLENKGFLMKETTPDGKKRRIPTGNGLHLGISTQPRQGKDGEYIALYYDANAQRFLLDHIFDILKEA